MALWKTIKPLIFYFPLKAKNVEWQIALNWVIRSWNVIGGYVNEYCCCFFRYLCSFYTNWMTIDELMCSRSTSSLLVFVSFEKYKLHIFFPLTSCLRIVIKCCLTDKKSSILQMRAIFPLGRKTTRLCSTVASLLSSVERTPYSRHPSFDHRTSVS